MVQKLPDSTVPTYPHNFLSKTLIYTKMVPTYKFYSTAPNPDLRTEFFKVTSLLFNFQKKNLTGSTAHEIRNVSHIFGVEFV
jgi:hypothetical protein